jgi:hypothetical protein
VKRIASPKSKEVKAGSNVAESSKESYVYVSDDYDDITVENRKFWVEVIVYFFFDMITEGQVV